MYASVSTYQVVDVDTLVQKIREELVERITAIEGCVEYLVVDGADGTVKAITVGQTPQAVDASIALAQHWVVQNASHLVEGAPNISSGHVRVHVCQDRS